MRPFIYLLIYPPSQVFNGLFGGGEPQNRIHFLAPEPLDRPRSDDSRTWPFTGCGDDLPIFAWLYRVYLGATKLPARFYLV